jgi:hypothetical protein
LKADDFEARSEAAKEEAETLAAAISTASVDERSSHTLKLAMRRRMVEEISKITRDLETKAREEEEWITKFPTVYGGEEVWIYFLTVDRGVTGCNALLMKKESGPLVAAQMRQKHPSEVWYMRYLSFVKAIEGLKQDILDGKYDERLGTDAAKLIFDALKDKVG